VRIPQAHELINSTSMSADHDARPYIASYWRAEGEDVPQYHLVFHDGEQWHTSVVSDRETPFRLSGTGTKRVPISRPQILAYGDGNQTSAYLLFRDSERGDKVSVAHTQNLISADNWMITDLTDFSVGMWEPTYDTELFKQTGRIHILVQRVRQGDGESKVEMPPQAISILEWSGHGL